MLDDIKDLKELIPILIFLLPGFLTAKVVDLTVITKPKDVFDKIVQAFVFTFINMIVFALARSACRHLLHVEVNPNEFFTAKNLALMLICAIGIGLVCSYEIKNEKVLSLLRDKNITKKTYKSSTWGETFSNAERWVVVHLKDGRRAYGWPRYYSDDPRERAIYLEKATWLDSRNQLLNNPPISIFLDKESGIQFVEFV